MKKHKDFDKIVKILEDQYGYGNILSTPEAHKELINDVIIVTENLKK